MALTDVPVAAMGDAARQQPPTCRSIPRHPSLTSHHTARQTQLLTRVADTHGESAGIAPPGWMLLAPFSSSAPATARPPPWRQSLSALPSCWQNEGRTHGVCRPASAAGSLDSREAKRCLKAFQCAGRSTVERRERERDRTARNTRIAIAGARERMNVAEQETE